jgi:hypothetical protein
LGFRRRTAKSAAPPPFAVLSKLEVGQKMLFFFNGVFVRFSTSNKGSSKTPQKLFWEKYMNQKGKGKMPKS